RPTIATRRVFQTIDFWAIRVKITPSRLILMNPLENYLQSVHDIYSCGAGVPETSGYGPLANLLNEVGKSLKPRVRCIINIANRGAGLPDGGLFTPDQFQKRAKGELIEGQLPSRGAIEVKLTSDEIDAIVASE